MAKLTKLLNLARAIPYYLSASMLGIVAQYAFELWRSQKNDELFAFAAMISVLVGIAWLYTNLVRVLDDILD